MMWDEIAIFLHRWQNLAGAIVGGLFALGVALLVSYLARNREDRAAAMILTAAFVSINARHSTLERLAKERSVSAADLHKWLAEKLVQSRPKLSSGFEGVLARLLLVHTRLAVHLELFRTLYHEMDEKLDRIDEDYKYFHEHRKALRPPDIMEADSKLASDSFAAAVRHANCAEHLLGLFVFARFPSWHVWRYKFLPSNDEKECKELDAGSNA